MLQLAGIIDWLYPNLPVGSYVIQQDTEEVGPYIAMWAVPGIAQPTLEYLASRLAEFEALPADWQEKRNKPERHALRRDAIQALNVLTNYLEDADKGTVAERQARDHTMVKRLAEMMQTVIKRLVQVD